MNLQEGTVLAELAVAYWPSYSPSEEAAAAHADLLSDHHEITFDEARAALRALARLGRDFYAGPGAVHRAVRCARVGLPVGASDDDLAADEEWAAQQARQDRSWRAAGCPPRTAEEAALVAEGHELG